MNAENTAVTPVLLGFTGPSLKAISVLAASNLLSAPQFALQANQASLLELSEVCYRYMTGGLNVTLESDKDASKPEEGAKFA